MGVRFQRRVKLGKAAHLNFSKSGVRLSLGVPGACVSIGPKGTLLSLGVPGTGLSYRKTTTALKSPISVDNLLGGKAKDKAKTLPDGDETKVLPDPAVEEVLSKELGAGGAGRVPTPDEQVRLAIAARLQELGEEVVGFGVTISVTEDGEERFVNTATGKPVTDPELIKLIRKMDAYQAMRAQIAAYQQAAASAKAQEAQEAQNRTDELVNVFRLAPVVAPRGEAKALTGEALPDAFDATEEEVLTAVNRWLATVEFPADIAAHFDFADGWLWVDLDLPEIEALPATEMRTLKSGQVKEAAKTQKKLREEYAKLVFGTGLFLAASAFSLHFAIDAVVISAYTQRRNTDGDLADDYIYSVAVPRVGLEARIIEDPETVFAEFPNRLRLSATKAFSVVKPFAPEDRPALEGRLAQ